jgi:hypothetical protein
MFLYMQNLSIFQAEHLRKKKVNKNTKHNSKLGNKVLVHIVKYIILKIIFKSFV